jgi:NAD(P)-dependent dehydrogenase (short-subunit alcohol dehydrogenase family)
VVGRVVSGRGDTGVGVGEVTGGRLTRLGNPMDVAYAALWLASDEAAFITGDLVGADGGFGINGDAILRG